MPLVYADTSALFAYFHPNDPFSVLMDAAVKRYAPDFVYWSFLRFELRHNLRRFKSDRYGSVAWQALRAAEKTAARLRWQNDLSPTGVLDVAEELSAENAAEINCGSGDVLHVAAARRFHLLSGLDEFWTCDEAQARLARAVGLKIRLFK